MESILSSIQAQYQVLNAMLKQYGIELELYAVRLSSEACDTCVEYITLVRFSDRMLYEEFVRKIKEMGYGGEEES